MTPERKSLAEDLADAVRPREEAGEENAALRVLEQLQSEHAALSKRRRRLHESIDLLDGLDVLKADAAARLELYRTNEESISRRRADVYRRMRELQDESRFQTEPR